MKLIKWLAVAALLVVACKAPTKEQVDTAAYAFEQLNSAGVLYEGKLYLPLYAGAGMKNEFYVDNAGYIDIEVSSPKVNPMMDDTE